MLTKKAILFIVDGLGGRPTDMDGQTCLEAADTPNLDSMVSDGSGGMMYSVGKGVAPGSDTAHLSILGYDLDDIGYSGRGIFEVLGYGIEPEKNDVCFRTNFATVDEEGVVEDRRAGRITEGQEELERLVNGVELNGADFVFKSTNQHRGVFILKDEGLSDSVTDVDPHEIGTEIKKCVPEEGEDSRRTADIVNEFVEKTRSVLEGAEINKRRKENGKKPANVLLLRGASKPLRLEPFDEKYGVDSFCVAAGPLYMGIARQVGMKVIKSEGATGDFDSDLLAKTKASVEGLEDKNFVFIHVKGADNAGHDGDAERKKRFLEKVDEAVGYLLDNLDWGRTRIAFTGDHSTPVELGNHSEDPVPIVYYGADIDRDSVVRIGEKWCREGDVGYIDGIDVVPALFRDFLKPSEGDS